MKFAHKLTLALLVVLAVVLSLCNTVLIGQQFRQELHTAQETLSADWQRESRAMQRTLVTPGSGSLAARVGSYLQAITEQNSLACAAYSVDGTSLYYALPTAVPLSEVEALLAQDGEPRMVLANNHTLLCAGTVVLPERCITLVIAQDAAPVWQARQARTRNALIVELLAMVLAGGLVLLLCRRMTRPLEQLEQASRQIAAGAYSQRTAIHGSDEIASLSRSFDEMAQDPLDPFLFRYGREFTVGREFKFGTMSGSWENMYKATQPNAPYTDTSMEFVPGFDPDNKWFLNADETGRAYKICVDIRSGKERMMMREFTPYETVWLVGDAAPGGWSLDDAVAMTRDSSNPYVMTWSGTLNAGELKFTCDRQSDWMGAWFMPAVNGAEPTGTEEKMLFIDKSDDDFKAQYIDVNVNDIDQKWRIAEAGTYTITLNQLTETITIAKQ